ncbi:MAG: glycosyltransferase family 39 protein [Solirubrobacterales bacterium]|nr:glycosyltransferase family 39 protein [Solirubrobacterales bacterium]
MLIDGGTTVAGERRIRFALRRPTGWTVAVAGLLLAAFLVRIWGVGHGLPYAYNADENAHFVPKAIGMFGHDLNPHYFVNPPAYTYVLHAVFAVWFGGRDGISEAYTTDPTAVFVAARVTAAVLGTLAVWLLYLTGKRFFDRRVGLLAAGLLAVAFLPVFYSKLALNDVPTLAPVCLCLWASAGILRFGRTRDYALAGLALGLAAATKYTGGIVLLPLLGAAAVQFVAPEGRGPATRGVAIAGGVALAGFVIANPYAVLSFPEFFDGLAHQNDAAADTAGKLGLTQDNGVFYYLWTLTWGLGWIPALAALGGLVWLYRDEPRLLWVLAPAPFVFLLFMGIQSRFFGRWLLPIIPIACLLAAYLALELADRAAARYPRLRPTLITLAVLGLCAQGAISTLHSSQVLSREDTRNEARAWMVANVPETQELPGRLGSSAKTVATRIVAEPVFPDGWAQDIGEPSKLSSNGNRWVKFPTSRSNFAEDGSVIPGRGRIVNIEDYERTLQPALIDRYEAEGYCWVVSGSTQRGRAEAAPSEVPGAIAYYAALERRGELVFEANPFKEGATPVDFNFDFSFNYAPLAFEQPGPVMQIYRLTGGRCAP